MEDYSDDDIYYPNVDTITSDIELRSGEQLKCACNLSVLILTILCDSGEKETSDQWQSLALAISMYASLLPDSCVVIDGEFERWRSNWINTETLETAEHRYHGARRCWHFLPKHQHLAPDHCHFADLIGTTDKHVIDS